MDMSHIAMELFDQGRPQQLWRVPQPESSLFTVKRHWDWELLPSWKVHPLPGQPCSDERVSKHLQWKAALAERSHWPRRFVELTIDETTVHLDV
jgi:hypothetical protein